MDASRLLEVLTDVEAEFSAGYAKHLQGVVQAYTQARDTPTQDLSQQISTAQERLAEHLAASVMNQYPPSKQRILEAIGGSDLVGESAGRALSNRLSAAGITGAALVTAATEFLAELERFRKACAQAKAGLESLRIEQHALQQGEYEVGVLIPRNISSGTLVGLKDQLNDWNTSSQRVLRAGGGARARDSIERTGDRQRGSLSCSRLSHSQAGFAHDRQGSGVV